MKHGKMSLVIIKMMQIQFLITFQIPSSGTFMLVFLEKRTKTKQNSNAWKTTGIKISCNTKRNLYLLCRESNDPKLKTYYRNYCKTLSKVITSAKNMYYNNKLANSSNKPKTTWSIIKTITNNKKNCNNILMMQIDGKVTTHYQTIAENFNHYYVSVTDNINNNKSTTDNSNKINLLNYLYSAFKQSFTNITVKNTTMYEIEKIIKELKIKKSCGYDDIMARILKISSPFTVSPLTCICSRMLTIGTFPDRLRFSEIKPIYKKGDKTLLTNYRPISLLPVFSNIFEKVIYKRLYYHLTSNNILVKEQFGFRCNNSTDTAIYTLINSKLSSLNDKILVGGLFCDLKKAFDCVNYDILPLEMKFYGTVGVAHKLMESYLRNRYQRVTINACNMIFS